MAQKQNILKVVVTPVFDRLQKKFNYDFKPTNIDTGFEGDPKKIFVLEGSSGSSKTTSILQNFIAYCGKNVDKHKKITCARAKYSWCQDSILKDFIDMLIGYGLYNEKDHVRTHPQSYTLYGNTIRFIGMDDPARFHGPRQDITYINEAMECDEDSYRQLEMRTNEAMILDFNPSYTVHWIFSTILANLTNKPNTHYFHSTFKDNTELPRGQRDSILSYEPTLENIKNGTASEYKWMVYGLGLRAAQKGTIFKYITWIDKFPENVNYWFSQDYGYSVDPYALVKVYIEGENLYLQKMVYEPLSTPELVSAALFAMGVKQTDLIASDSADIYNGREFNKELKQLGWNVKPVSKTKGVSYWIGQLEKYKLHIVESREFHIEAENYKWREINGIQINEPKSGFDHLWDASRYGIMMNQREKRRSRMWGS